MIYKKKTLNKDHLPCT